MLNTKQIFVQQSNYNVTPKAAASAFGDYYAELDLTKQSDYPAKKTILAVVSLGAYQISNANILGITSVTGYWAVRLNATTSSTYAVRVAYLYKK